MKCDIIFKIEDENILYRKNTNEDFVKTTLTAIESLHLDRIKAYKIFSKKLYDFLYEKKSPKRLVRLNADVIISDKVNIFTRRGIERFLNDLDVIRHINFIN